MLTMNYMVAYSTLFTVVMSRNRHFGDYWSMEYGWIMIGYGLIWCEFISY